MYKFKKYPNGWRLRLLWIIEIEYWATPGSVNLDISVGPRVKAYW